jgi:dCMP deaminase
MNPAKQDLVDHVYMEMAKSWSKLSYAKRLKVGALIVKNGSIISDGYNGTPSGFENECEEVVNDENGNFVGYRTKWYVLHAEANAILKVAKSTQSCDGGTLYITSSPCAECSKLILQAGIKRLVYEEEYRDVTGLELLKKAGIEIKKLNPAE